MNLIELSVLVPEERVSDFYVMLGKWLGGNDADSDEGGEARNGRRRGRRPRANTRAALTSRYAGIGEYLKSQSGPTAEVSFEELEEAIGNTLPASAERHRAWWANTERNTQARVWMEEGWRVDSVDFPSRQVTFSRT